MKTFREALLEEPPSINSDLFLEVIPELRDEVGLDQKNPWHHLDVWGHTLLAMDLSPTDLIIRLALLLHDIGKPSCMFVGDDGIGHFHGHPQKGFEMVQEILQRFDFLSDEDREVIANIVRNHDNPIGTNPKTIRKKIIKWGDNLDRLIEVQRADALAHHPDKLEARTAHLDGIKDLIEEVKLTM